MAHLLDVYQYRVDGRLAEDIRKIISEFNLTRQADGSVCLEQGNTSILASIYGPHEVDDFHKPDPMRAIINCNFSQASFTSSQWRKHMSGGRRVNEIEEVMKRTFESAIQLDLYPRSQIDIFLEVIQADGSILSACINASTLALIDSGIPLLDFVCASSAAILGRTVVVDVSSAEDLQSIPQLTLAIMPKTQKLVQLSVTGRVHSQDLIRVIDVAMDGSRKVYLSMKDMVRQHLSALSVSVQPN